MSNVSIDHHDQEFIRAALKARLREFGKGYQGSYAEDLEIAAIQRLAEQIGGRFTITPGAGSFSVE